MNDAAAAAAAAPDDDDDDDDDNDDIQEKETRTSWVGFQPCNEVLSSNFEISMECTIDVFTVFTIYSSGPQLCFNCVHRVNASFAVRSLRFVNVLPKSHMRRSNKNAVGNGSEMIRTIELLFQETCG